MSLLPGELWAGEHPGLVLLQLHQSLCQQGDAGETLTCSGDLWKLG